MPRASFCRNHRQFKQRVLTHVAAAAAVDLEALEADSVANVAASPSGTSPEFGRPFDGNWFASMFHIFWL